MNKKLVTLATSLVIGGTLLGTTAFASANTSSGYDTYKNALLNMHNVKSMTDTITASITDNGTSLLSANLAVKMNKAAGAASGDINVKCENGAREIDVYRQNGETIAKSSDSDVYDIVNTAAVQAQNMAKKPDPKRIQDLQNIVDSIIGNSKNYFVLTDNSDGTKSVDVKLSENQISPVVNAVASAVIKNGESKAESAVAAQNKIASEFPKLVSDIRIINVDVNAVINNAGVLQSQTGTLTLEGKDASGADHTLVLNIDLNVSNINATTPDTVNLAGKQVKTVTPAHFNHKR